METERVYFPNLNGLRFIAALLVIVHHLEQFKSLFQMENRWKTSAFVQVIGKLGVVLFFVLSGFLITYLLLVEERSSGTIRVGKFYVRRALRIWPLYFLTIGLGLAVYPHLDFLAVPRLGKDVALESAALRWTLYLSFLPNLALAWLGTLPYVSHTWSIGTEEQFYLLWPLVLSAGRRFRPVLIASVGLLCVVARTVLSSHFIDHPFKRVTATFLGLFTIDCMAIGGFVALLAFNQSRHLRWLRSSAVFYSTVCLLIALLGWGVHFWVLHYDVYSVLFAILILNLATRPEAARALENKPLRYLGTISYGLYMYHPLCIVLAILLVRQAGLRSDFVLYPLAVGLVITLSAVSYRFFERPFLKAKVGFTVVASGGTPNSG